MSFIEPTGYPRTCAPAERNVSGNGTRDRLKFRSSGARRNLLEVACSINISSLRDQGKRVRKILLKNEELDLCITEAIDSLAPEEPNIYRSNYESQHLRSSGAQCFRQ